MSKTILDKLYDALDLDTESLLTASSVPCPEQSADDWLDKGEWLTAAKRAGAEKLFFVGNNPVAVFAECDSDYSDKTRVFNRIWCLGRPRLLFLASPGEISVLDLAQEPINESMNEQFGRRKKTSLEILQTANDTVNIAEALQEFHRDNIESGKLFAEQRFGDIKNRADKALIRDLKTVRKELMQIGLTGENLKYAHALIGRSIFIRYLEDRKVISKKYFTDLCVSNPEWIAILEQNPDRLGIDISGKNSYYALVLQSKKFTYTLFRALAHDFNGDMFLHIDDEEKAVSTDHLKRIQDLIYGDVGNQMRLFFHSYDFEIIPLDLISSIYEEFYDSAIGDSKENSKARMDGAFYTPTVLAELTVSRILTHEALKQTPRVLDPACGSGIFLVEAFRRIVRYEYLKRNEQLGFDDLKQILKDQIIGIESNEEAARITAFSLSISLLHYLSPPDISNQIAKGNKLPNLLATKESSDNYFQCIFVGNAFDTDEIENYPLWNSRFGKNCADIIVSNPPWGSLGGKKDASTLERNSVALNWCKKNERTIGNKEASQAFLWRYLDFLESNGSAAVLVSAGVFLKHSTKSQQFRKEWMSNVHLKEVYNFTHVRNYFFRGAISPFALTVFTKVTDRNTPVIHWSAKRVTALEKTQAVLLNKYDIGILHDEEVASDELWKTYWFGRFPDRRFIRWLQTKTRLDLYLDLKDNNSGRGYQLASRSDPAGALQPYKALIKLDSRYDYPRFTDPPKNTERLGATGAYHGLRVLINEGISQKSNPKGVILAQFHYEPFCFYRSLYALKLLEHSEERHKVLTGILWSSLARYYFFMTSSNWGIWYDKLLVDEVKKLPVVFEDNHPATTKILNAVNNLIGYQPSARTIDNPNGVDESEITAQRSIWESELDEAVYELYGLSEEQKDLIRDFCEITLPFFYEPIDGACSKPALEGPDATWLKENYVDTFSQRWNTYLYPDMEMGSHLHIGAHGSMVAIEFFPMDKSDQLICNVSNDSWSHVLNQLAKALAHPIGTSQIIIDGMIHAVSDDSIIIIKKNERRFWTRSIAREDAEISLSKRMSDTSINNDGGRV